MKFEMNDRGHWLGSGSLVPIGVTNYEVLTRGTVPVATAFFKTKREFDFFNTT